MLVVTIYLKLEQKASRSMFFVAADMNTFFDRYFEMRAIFWFLNSIIFARMPVVPSQETNII